MISILNAPPDAKIYVWLGLVAWRGPLLAAVQLLSGADLGFSEEGGGHTLIEKAISYHFSQKGCMCVRAPGHPRHAAPCREQSGDETIWNNGGCGHIILFAHD